MTMSLAKFSALLALAAPHAMVVAQGLGIADIVAGKGHPATLAPQDLPDEFRAVHIVSAGPVPNAFASMLPYMGLGMSTGDGSNPEYFDVVDESWTDGSIEEVEGQRFLVTYRLNVSTSDFVRRSGTPPTAPKPKMPNMRLTLVKVDGIQSITPNPELTKDRFLSILGVGRGKTVFDEASEAASQTATLSNIKQISLATTMYAMDYDDVLPYAQGTKAVQYVTHPYLKNNDVWKTQNPNGGEFRFNLALGGVESSAIDVPAETVLFYETNAWPDGRRAVGYADGHAKLVTEQEWARLQSTLTRRFPKKAKRPLPMNYGMDWVPGK